ncbi:acyloxyacyl hydrolase [Magnetovibrio sp. PR-2]|uniref:acyloxyacyl hydrolase n=1 Tax=Magnetovibrio sp. PR-2 TaxID=3120356 RepID=UPI002FCE331F
MFHIFKSLSLFAFSAILVASIGLPSQAADLVHEVKLGLLHHDTGGLWSGTNRESGVDLNLEAILEPSTAFLSGTVRPAVGASLNSGGDTSKAYIAARWEKDLTDDVQFALGVGGAVHNGNTKLTRNDRKALGSEVLFYFPFELSYSYAQDKSVSLFYDHVSNAWLASPNEGMDTLGIRFGFSF